MAYVFTTTIDATTDLADTSIWTVLTAAVAERAGVSSYWPTGGHSFAFPTYAPGSDWSLTSNIALLQTAIQTVMYDFINQNTYFNNNTDQYCLAPGFTPADPITGLAIPDAGWTILSARSALGLPVIQYNTNPSRDGVTWVMANDVFGSFRRTRYRELAYGTLTAGTPYTVTGGGVTEKIKPWVSSTQFDTNFNAQTVGQRAFYLVDGSAYRCISVDGTTGFGTWIRDQNGSTGGAIGSPGPVDILDSTLAAPNSLIFQAGSFAGAYGQLGVQLPGDIHDYIPLAEIRAITNLLRWTWGNLFIAFGSHKQVTQTLGGTTKLPKVGQLGIAPDYTSDGSGKVVVASVVSYADLTTKMASLWTGMPTVATSGGGGVSVTTELLVGGWGGYIVRTDFAINMTGLTTIKKDVDFFVFGDPNGGTFDAEGDGVQNGAYNLYATVAASALATVPSPTFGSSNTYPSTVPASPGQSGYSILQWACIARYDVAGGFANIF